MECKDINKMTLEELDKLVQEKKNINLDDKEYCIIRTYSAGVFAGLIDRSVKGKENTIYNSRRLWYWSGACSLSQLANEGTKKPENCKFAQEVAVTDLKEIVEVIVCTEKARKVIESVDVWQK